ncbi:MlaD family protein [Mesocricetibacter intestinalis]|uniref:MlaD family protein n=1 Tax=Mesocricetibacter intestinalis TaxID=1521930 RepID=UPI00105E0D00|nr:MlaD family protein [Mesocricetibacter intestinalis]
MTDNKQNNLPRNDDSSTLKSAEISRLKRISPFWLLPLIAFCICALLFFQIIKEQGYTVKITFANGDGLVANKTQIRYQGLQIGVVKKVNFTDDLKKVEVEANIYPEAKTVLRKNTRFWLVQPSASLAGISGLDTLISGNYITLQPGDGEYSYEFKAESEGPIAQVDDGDLLIRLLADDLGSISAGASVYFKKLPVGKVYDYRFTKDQKKVEIQVVIEKPYVNLVKKDSRFWNISGINATVGPSGVHVNMDSLNAVVQGAIAFDSPENSPAATENQDYQLYTSLAAAKRGIQVNISVPNSAGLQANKTAVYYQNIEVGTLSQLLQGEDIKENQVSGKLLLNPNIADLLTTGTKIVLRKPKVNLANLADLPRVFRGEYLEIIPGEGEASDSFQVLKENELLLQQPDTLVLELKAAETYGLSEGQPIYYNNILIGELVGQHIDIEGVNFKAAIAAKYRHLIYADTQFVAAANLEINLNAEGLRFEAATPEKWLQGGIRVIENKNQGKALSSYPLYKDLSSAEAGITDNRLRPTLTLTAQNLPSISKGSLVLYRQYEVGKILEVRPTQSKFEIDVAIYPKYRHLLSDKSLFWVESAAQIDISPKGISIQATPIGRSLKGAISFDNSGGGNNKTLYANELRAKSAGQIITLRAENATNLSKGMALRYMGLDVGEIDNIRLDQTNNKIIATALMNPAYMQLLAKEGSTFSVISPQISAGGIENLGSLLQPYIDISAGTGKFRNQFHLSDNNMPENNKYHKGFPLILETNDASNLSIGAPILYRGVEVGKIHDIGLNKLGDRVLIRILIATKYQHLVRNNSEFWVSSGYSAELGWSGLAVNTGSVQQLLKGGISFSTPDATIVQPQAKPHQRFLLQIKRPEQAKQWTSGAIPNSP